MKSVWDKSGTNREIVILQKVTKVLIGLVIAARLERATYCLEGLFSFTLKMTVNAYNHAGILCNSIRNSIFNRLIMSKRIQLIYEGIWDKSGTKIYSVHRIYSEHINPILKNKNRVSALRLTLLSTFLNSNLTQNLKHDRGVCGTIFKRLD